METTFLTPLCAFEVWNEDAQDSPRNVGLLFGHTKTRYAEGNFLLFILVC